MRTAAIIESLGETRAFETRFGSRVAIVGGGMLGTTLALRYRQAGRIVSLFDAAQRLERRGHAAIASTDKHLLGLVEELGLSSEIVWHPGLTIGSRLGALAGGKARIVEGLRQRARLLDVDLRLNTPVLAIHAAGTGFVVETATDSGEYDQVVLAVPAGVAAELTPVLTDAERRSLNGVDYVGIVSVSFVLDRRLGRRYVTRVARGNEAFTLFDPSSDAAVSQRSPVVYVSRPASSRSPLFADDDRGVIENFARALPGTANIVSARVMRAPHAYADRRLRSYESSIPGLYLVNAAHHGAGRNYLERTAALATDVFRTLCAERILLG